jgi:hypothetical protein
MAKAVEIKEKAKGEKKKPAPELEVSGRKGMVRVHFKNANQAGRIFLLAVPSKKEEENKPDALIRVIKDLEDYKTVMADAKVCHCHNGLRIGEGKKCTQYLHDTVYIEAAQKDAVLAAAQATFVIVGRALRDGVLRVTKPKTAKIPPQIIALSLD